VDYIIIDFEFNQFYEENEERKGPEERCRFEIIQIGAVKIDQNFKRIGTFNGLIKPQLYKQLHPFVEKLTNISVEQLRESKTFEVVIKEFIEFIGGNHHTLVTWGMGDLRVLKDNLNYYKIDTTQVPTKYINIQKYASSYLNTPKHTNIGLENAIRFLGLEVEEVFHDALNDAVYTSEIFKIVYSEEISEKIYNYDEPIFKNEGHQLKKTLDQKALIKQFEKMKERKLSKEEIEMITLSYRMGATQQFLV
jgi:inhibitor of KinA sporulation pathway (predicted exonuclease)